MKDVASKIRRLLYVVPYVAKHADGVPVERLAKLLGVDREEMLADLDLLSQVGPPDGDPGQYLLVSVEEGRVFVDLPHRLTRPLRLTAIEGCSLLLGIRALQESGIAPFDEAMQSAQQKLLQALGKDASEAQSLAGSTIVASPDQTVGKHLREAISATRGRHGLVIDYASASSHRTEQRRIDPYGLVHHAGAWYLVAHCHERGDVRTFRVDRIASLSHRGETFPVPREFDLEAYRREQLYVPSADAVTVTVHLDPLAVTRVGANWPVGEVTLDEDGSAELLIDCEGFEWITGWALGLGSHAWIVHPPEARAAMAARVQTMQQMHVP